MGTESGLKINFVFSCGQGYTFRFNVIDVPQTTDT